MNIKEEKDKQRQLKEGKIKHTSAKRNTLREIVVFLTLQPTVVVFSQPDSGL